MINKYFLLFIGFIVSWIVAILLFYPQPGGYDLIATAFSVIIYGFSWIIPITFFILGFSKGKSVFRNVIANRFFSMTLYTVLISVMIVSWKNKFSNDLVFIGFWVLVTLTWINIYLNLKCVKCWKEKN